MNDLYDYIAYPITYKLRLNDLQVVNDLTRMRIALDLVLRSHNAKAINVVEKAMCYWRKNVGSSRHGRQR
ncbi:hypothetical protein S83_004051 [Arachis hypogaea]